MPGQSQHTSDTVEDYLVSLGAGESRGGRSTVIERNRQATSSFIDHLHNCLADKNMQGDVEEIVQPSSLPFVALRCTADVAEMVGAMPEVCDVIEVEAIPPLERA